MKVNIENKMEIFFYLFICLDIQLLMLQFFHV
jgi:hypothetical protein